MDELKPCPFCGTYARLDGTTDPKQFVVRCMRRSWCGVVRGHTEVQAVAAWNTRSAMPIARDDGKLREALEKLNSAIEIACACEQEVILDLLTEVRAALASTVEEGGE